MDHPYWFRLARRYSNPRQAENERTDAAIECARESAAKAAETEKETAKMPKKARKRERRVIAPLHCFLFFAFSAIFAVKTF